MKILVCLKAVPSTAEVSVDGSFRLRRDGTSLEWNVADQGALEAALSLKGADGAVTVITMGPEKCKDHLRELFSRGADRALLLTDSAFAGSDTYATACILSEAVRKTGPYDLILCGRRAIDGETGQVPGMLAAALGLPSVSNAECVLSEEGALLVKRRLEDREVTLSVPLPAVVSVCEYTYSLRLPGILGMRRAKGKEVETLSLADLGLDPEQCGLVGSLTRVIGMDTRFPGLRKGPRERELSVAVSHLREMLGREKR